MGSENGVWEWDLGMGSENGIWEWSWEWEIFSSVVYIALIVYR